MSRTARTYRVTGPTAILGHEPGTVFEATVDERQERRLLERGQLAIEYPARSSARPARPAGATAPRKRRRKPGISSNSGGVK